MALDKYKVFKDLAGQWTFVREIKNTYSAQLSGHVTGVAEFMHFKDLANVLHYVEHGDFITDNDHRNTVTQEYFYKFSDSGEIEVYFASAGKMLELFHVINDASITTHVCKNDRYHIQYEFYIDQFSITYSVIGPQKNYISKTIFKRKI